MKIAVIGTRGFPNVQGGVENHCQKLYTRLAKMGCEITVFTRQPYVDPQIKTFENINLIPIACPKIQGLEAIIHTFKSIIRARKICPDIVHFHAIGPSLLIPLARIMRLKVVMTNHGPDYKRKKWSIFAKFILKLGEIFGSYWANEIICISDAIAEDIRKSYNRNTVVIPNGVDIPEILEHGEILNKLHLKKNTYIMTVGRFVPEKGFDNLIDAFNRIEQNDWKLVIVGTADHETKYSRKLKKQADKYKNIIFTGFLSGRPLQELYSLAGLFVLPSYYEGVPLALLDAMSYGLPCLVSDISVHRSISLPEANYFKVGDIHDLSEKLEKFLKNQRAFKHDTLQVDRLRHDYNWDDIAQKTLEVYKKLCQKI